jgi:pyruvyltransferase
VYQHPTTKNFGDTLSLPILSHFAGRAVERADRDEAGKVLAVGSVMHCMRPDDVVWGTGVQEDRRYSGARTTFLAVRGPISRAAIDNADVPAVYGDPGLLLPHVYDPDVEVTHDLGIVPHYLDAMLSRQKHPDALHISVKRDWRHVVRRIKSCRRVIATSLHGIVAAEAYGVPVVWHGSYSRKLVSTNLKFQDYFLGTGRECQRPGVLDPLPRDVWDDRCRGLVEAFLLMPR